MKLKPVKSFDQLAILEKKDKIKKEREKRRNRTKSMMTLHQFGKDIFTQAKVTNKEKKRGEIY